MLDPDTVGPGSAPDLEPDREIPLDTAEAVQTTAGYYDGKTLEESEAFLETEYDSVQAFKEALEQAFPQPEKAVPKAEEGNGRRP